MFFSTFAHATCTLSVCNQYLGLGFNAPVFALHAHASLLFATTSETLGLRGCHSLWPLLPKRSAHIPDGYRCTTSPAILRLRDSVRPVRLLFALLAALNSLSFPAGTKIFQFPAYAHPLLGVIRQSRVQNLTCGYPGLIAACHGLLSYCSLVIP